MRFPRELFWSGLLSWQFPLSPYFSCVQQVHSCSLQTSGVVAPLWEVRSIVLWLWDWD